MNLISCFFFVFNDHQMYQLPLIETIKNRQNLKSLAAIFHHFKQLNNNMLRILLLDLR